jgi:hypothetical protein
MIRGTSTTDATLLIFQNERREVERADPFLADFGVKGAEIRIPVPPPGHPNEFDRACA